MERLKEAVQELVDFVEEHETRILAYSMFIDEQAQRMTVVQVHPNSASMETHLETAAEVFGRFGDLIQLRTMDVYGYPSEKLVAQLEKKVRLLGTARVQVHEPQAGFSRLEEVKD